MGNWAATSSQLVKVPFHGDELDAVQDEGGKVWVSLRRCCENLGIDVESQRKKLKEKPWATTVENTAVAEDGKSRAMTCIDLDTLPMWLASIETRKLKPAIRDKLIRYQKECARVLADHFFRKPAGAASLTVSDVVKIVAQCMTEMLPQIMQPILAQQAIQRETQRDLTPIHNLETVASRLSRLLPHWSTSRSQRGKITGLARRNVKGALSQEPLWCDVSGRLQFLPHMHYHLDTAILQVYREACRDNEVDDFGLFKDDGE